jgi:hypothetical protein
MLRTLCSRNTLWVCLRALKPRCTPASRVSWLLLVAEKAAVRNQAVVEEGQTNMTVAMPSRHKRGMFSPACSRV